jgi:cardiolipin synthase (CMP-forming)
MTLPNLITTIRIILTPIFVIYIINDELITGLIILIICGLSDGIDGLVARLFNQKSKLGAYLDPLADKIIITSAFVTLSIRGFLPSWLTVMVISRDILILMGVFILFLTGMKIEIKPSISSKITTCFQFLTVIFVLSKSYLSNFEKYYPYFFYLTACFTVISFLQYMHGWFKLTGDAKDSNHES